MINLSVLCSNEPRSTNSPERSWTQVSRDLATTGIEQSSNVCARMLKFALQPLVPRVHVEHIRSSEDMLPPLLTEYI